jgi:drug/metabolite transporter (DMT)-like permease
VIAIALAFTASIGWGFSDFLGGLRARRVPLAAVVGFTLVGGTLAAVVAAVVAAGPFPGYGPLWPVVFSGVGSLVAFTALFKALSIGPMSIVSPISATYPIVPVVVGLVQGERPSPLQGAGMALAVAGVLLAVSSGAGLSGRRQRITMDGLGFALLAALASGVMLTGLDIAAEADPYWALLGARCVALALLLVTLPVLRPDHSARRTDAAALIGIGVLDTAATGLFAVASTFGYLSIVAVIASLFPVMTVILARMVLGERIARHQEVGIAGALAGVALIAAG